MIHLNKYKTLFPVAIILLGMLSACHQTTERERERYMPGGNVPEKLWVFEMQPDYSWNLKNALYCFQGLINRKDTRIYFLEKEQDQFWLEYYQDHYGIPSERITGLEELLSKFSDDLDGYLIYDGENPHTLNTATTIGSVENLLPVTPDLEDLMIKCGLEKKMTLPVQLGDRLEIYRSAMQEWLPKCNRNMLATLCVHNPHWPTSTIRNRDYIMAHKIFSFDLSSSERDKSDYYLTKEIYGQLMSGAIVMGWHCVRDKEHEAIGLSSQYGHFGMCSLHTSNLTVHSSIPVPAGKVYQQRTLDTASLVVENKVYVAYMATDGDASWFMADLVSTDWADGAHGEFKYNWGFLPLGYDLMPGTVNYYLENAKSTDYFVAGPAGATYTYPHLHPEPHKFLRLSNEYMHKCGLQTVHMTNWNDRDWWQEVDLPWFYDTLLNTMPDAMGFVRGMGESAFEANYLDKQKPYIFCGEGIHRGDDIYQVMKEFIDACPNRPLFIYNLVNHSIPIGEIKKAMDRFQPDEVEVVHLDELLFLAEKAYRNGMIGEDLYPEKTGLQKILSKEARKAWPKLLETLMTLNSRIDQGEKAYLKVVGEEPTGVEPVIAGDHLAFTTIWHSMSVIKLALEAKGIYVNNKSVAIKRFNEEFSGMADVAVTNELHEMWQQWHRQNPDFSDARALTKRLTALAERIDGQLK